MLDVAGENVVRLSVYCVCVDLALAIAKLIERRVYPVTNGQRSHDDELLAILAVAFESRHNRWKKTFASKIIFLS